MMRVQSILEIWVGELSENFETKTQWEKLMLHPQSLRMKIIVGLLLVTMKTAKRYETPCQSEHLASSFPVVFCLPHLDHTLCKNPRVSRWWFQPD